jgi:hypothetical protein
VPGQVAVLKHWQGRAGVKDKDNYKFLINIPFKSSVVEKK